MNRNDTRPITILGNTWEYKIGRNTVAIYDPEGNRYFPKFTDIVPTPKLSANTIMFEKMIGRSNPIGQFTQLNPAVIQNYILKNIIESTESRKCSFCNRKKADVILRVNPFAAEINQDYTKHFMCNECSANAAEEI